MAAAMQIAGRKERVVAVVGDGALTGGLALEGLNNAFYLHRNLVVVLNDNKMSISPQCGIISPVSFGFTHETSLPPSQRPFGALFGQYAGSGQQCAPAANPGEKYGETLCLPAEYF